MLVRMNMSAPAGFVGSAFLVVALSVSASAQPTFAGQVAAQECRSRGGIGNTMAKINSGKPIKIAYFGGSITEMDGWRRLSREWLQGQYPNCPISEVAAAIGGTGSSLGVFRYGQDVLQKKPDLVFIEFATNDRGSDVESVWRNFDGIVRQTWKTDPGIDIVFVYTVVEDMLPDYRNGLCPRITSAMEQLADYYGIPSICFGPRVTSDVVSGRLVMTVGEAATAVPKETPNEDQAIIDELAKQGKMLFAKDGVHPVLAAAQTYYLESFKAAWPLLASAVGVDHASKLDPVFFDATLEAAKTVPVEPEMLVGTWKQVEPGEGNASFATQFGCKPWFTETPGSRLRFRFKGSRCLLYDLLGPATGQLWVWMDGKRSNAPYARFDSYSSYYRLSAMSFFSGADGVHDVEIELDAGQPSRAAVAESVTNPLKYDGTKWYLGKIMLVGDICQRESKSGRKGFWFDGNVEHYEKWPQDAEFAEGGDWQSDTGDLPDVASVPESGALAVETLQGNLNFVATESKTFGEEVGKVVVESELVFNESVNFRPEVSPSDKGGLVAIAEGGETNYYGLAKVGISNEWVELEGPQAVIGSDSVKVRIVLSQKGAATVVNYNIAGVDYAVAGMTDIPVVVSSSFEGATYGGGGIVRSLLADVERPKQGVVIVVR